MPKTVISPSFLDQLQAFIALEAPFLGSVPNLNSIQEIEDLLIARLGERFHIAPERRASTIHPGLTLEQGARSEQHRYEIAIRGFFRRHEIRQSLSPEERLEMLSTMLLTRAVDEELKYAFDSKKITWQDHPSPQKGFRSTGQEAIVGVSLRLRRPPSYAPGPNYEGDIIAPMIRDLGALMMFHRDPLHPLLVQYGKTGTPVGGRDLHTGNLDYGILPPAAPLTIATQTLAGIAYTMRERAEDRVCVSFIGDGGSSLGEWHETINLAATQKLPMLFIIENNQWALGTHVSQQSAARRFAEKGRGYGVPSVTLFGNDPDEIASGVAWAAERARAGEGPTLIELVSYRRPGHAHHDDDRYHGMPEANVAGYEIESERIAWEAADPIDLYEERLRALGLIDDDSLERMNTAISVRIAAALADAEAAPWPTPDTYRDLVYAERVGPAPTPDDSAASKTMSYDEAIRQAMSEMMEEDPEVFVLGEDVGGRYGGAFGVTRGLAKSFGDSRCLNTPLAESAIVGCGVGAAIAGKRPIVEIQFADFLATGFNPSSTMPQGPLALGARGPHGGSSPVRWGNWQRRSVTRRWALP